MSGSGFVDHPATAWVVAQVPRGRRVLRTQRLTGGLTSEVTAWTVEDAAGRTHRFVMRRWTGQPWPDGAVDDGRVLVPREAAILQGLEPTGVPAPRVVAVDPTGDAAGLPALLMTRLPGRLDLTPDDPDAWTRQLAEQLARIHDIEPWPDLPAYESWLHLDRAAVPVWSSQPQVWLRALDLVRSLSPTGADRFVHHDYQEFNVLWSRGRLCGVVDWVWASRGPVDVDLTHARLNLCLLYGADRAIAFEDAYVCVTGSRIDPWWDLAGTLDYLPDWQTLELQKQAGRRLRVPDVTAMRHEVERLLIRTLRRA